MKKKHIGILINCLEFGGAQKIAVSLFKFLNQSKSAFLFHVDSDVHKGFFLKDYEKFKTKIVKLTNLSVKSNTLRKAAFIPFVILKIVKFLKKNKIDIVISFMERSNIINLMLPIKVKKVISIRNYPSTFYKKKSFFKRVLNDIGYKFLLKRADIINFNSKESACDFQNLYGIEKEKINVIYNFINVNEVRINAEKEEISPQHSELFKGKVIINVARLTYQKCQTRLIRAFKDLTEHYPNVKLLIIGDGPLYKDLKKLISLLNLKKKVFLLGYIKNPLPYVKNSDIFVLSSSNEGFPNVILEALALGTPVVSTDCSSGPREILAPDTNPMVKTTGIDFAKYGILTPSFKREIILDNGKTSLKEKLLSKAMLKLIEDEEMRKRYSEAGKNRVNDFLPEKIIVQWEELIEKL